MQICYCGELFTVSFLSLITGQEVVTKPQGKAELRRQYLLEKYVWKWKQFMRSRKGEGLFPRFLKLSHNNWLRQVQKMKNTFCFASIISFLLTLSLLSHKFETGDQSYICCRSFSHQPLRQPDRQLVLLWRH